MFDSASVQSTFFGVASDFTVLLLFSFSGVGFTERTGLSGECSARWDDGDVVEMLCRLWCVPLDPRAVFGVDAEDEDVLGPVTSTSESPEPEPFSVVARHW